MRAPWSIVLVLVLAMLGAGPLACRVTESADPATPADSAGDAETQGPSQADGQACGSPGLGFSDHGWVPADARMLTSLDRRDDDLSPALEQLGALARDPAAGLPVIAAMDFQNLGLQLGIFERILGALGFDPAEVVEIVGPRGELAWAWASDCPVELVSARLLARWQLLAKADLQHPGVRLGLGDPDHFPFDLILIGERRVIVTMAGKGRATLDWLMGAGPSDPDAPPAAALAHLQGAPVRSVLLGEWLLGSGASSPDPPPTRTVRATATSVELDGTQWPSP